MAEFPKLSLRRYPKIQERESNEARYWKSFTNTKQSKLHGAPNTIHFNPVDSRQYIVTHSTSISLYETVNDSVVRSYTRFSDDAFSGKFRKDGKLIIAGDKEGYVKVFDVQTKSILRQLRRHSAAVRATAWTTDALHFISGADDGRVKHWDLAAQEVIWETKTPHTDYVRCVDVHPHADTVFLSGGYDHSAQLWDTRQQHSILTLPHDHPVTAILMNPSGSLVYTASGSEVKVWDVLSGGRCLQTFHNHQKDISALAMDAAGARLFSTGLDGHLKIYNLQTMKVAHGIRFESPLLSAALSPNASKLVVGCVDGTLLAHTRTPKSLTTATASQEAKASLQKGNYFTGIGEGIVVGKVDPTRHLRLRPYEKLLKQFDYQKALDSALKSENPTIITSMLEEFCRRSGLTIALSGRDELGLEALLAFAIRHISNPKYTPTIVQTVSRLLDLYGTELGYAESLLEACKKLRSHVQAEVSFQRQIMRILGSLDALVNAGAVVQLPRDRSTSIVDL